MTWWDAVKKWLAGRREEKFPVPGASTPEPSVEYNGAAEWLAKRANLTTVMGSREIAEEWTAKARAQAFFSARVAEDHILERLRRVSDAYSSGKIGLAEARTELKRFLRAEGKDDGTSGLRNLASTARLDLILEQNARMAAAVGQYQVGMDPDIRERFPCWRYIGSTALNPRDSHARFAGKVFRKDDPIWHKIFPPSDFNCKCSVEDCDDEPDRVPETIEPPESGFAFDPAHAFEEFDLSSIRNEELRKKTEEGLKKKFGKQNNSKERKLKPNGTPVSNALDVRVTNKALKEDVKHAITTINVVHGDGELMKTPIFGRAPDGGALGCFTRYIKAGNVVQTDIKIARFGEHRCMTAVHEIGHLIDAFGLGNGVTTGVESATQPEIKRWLDTVINTQSYQRLSRIQDPHSVYLQKPKELWARCYAQYIARKSKDPILKEELDKMINCEYNKIYHAQWADEEFSEIMAAMDQIFISKGWLK